MKISMLDCTLRDGGYVNEWKFGRRNIETIIENLTEAGMDIVECGYLCDDGRDDLRLTKVNNVDALNAIISKDKLLNCEFAMMIDLGNYDVDRLCEYHNGAISIIRLAFHKRDIENAFEVARNIQDKGYKVFLQPMVSLCYTDKEFLELIDRTNKLMPAALYIVDSFGEMKKRDLIRLFLMVDHNLNDKVQIGYHSHNNMQLAYSNAQALIEEHTDRELIVDATVMGMGRGAGNLNTELFAQYLNEEDRYRYNIQKLLRISDKVLNRIYSQSYWGYSLAHYISARHNCHPNYASYLNEKNNLTIDEIDMMLSKMPSEKKVSFDREYVEQIYLNTMMENPTDYGPIEKFIEDIKGRCVLIIAPGKSSLTDKDKINDFVMKNEPMVISLNHEYEYCHTDYVFFSNIRRYKENGCPVKKKAIITSNIAEEDAYIKTDYKMLLNDCDGVADNAGMMLIKFLTDKQIQCIYLAGMDGYGPDETDNYADEEYIFNTSKERMYQMNLGMNQMLNEYSKIVNIVFLTQPHYIGEGIRYVES